tara:strand:- start:478 stop:681 length:204 start_codon:yes stop_codon:yes gene_type:complete
MSKMTLTEFNILTFEDKYKTALDRSVFLYNNSSEGEKYECYSFTTFTVEIVFDDKNEIIEFRSFSDI